MSNVRMSRNVDCTDDLIKQKVSPALALFDMNLTTALKNEHGEKKETLDFLKIFNDCTTQLLSTVST